MSRRLGQDLHAAQSRPTLREWQARGADVHRASDFVLPLFIVNDEHADQPVPSLPGVSRLGRQTAVDYLKPLVADLGLKTVLLFPVMSVKGIDKATDPKHNPLLLLIADLKRSLPDLMIMCDVCLCGFSDTGHCCTFDANKKMDNEDSIEQLAQIALAYANAGCDLIAPSDMMDGRIGAIR